MAKKGVTIREYKCMSEDINPNECVGISEPQVTQNVENSCRLQR